jgi:hypothetical protein
LKALPVAIPSATWAFRPPMAIKAFPACHSERSEESASYVLIAKADPSSLRSSG